MITNANITRLDRRTAAGPTGRPIYTPGDAVRLPCNLSDVTEQQRTTLGSTIKDASRVCRILVADLKRLTPALTAPSAGDRLVVILAEEGEWTGEVTLTNPHMHGTLSHYQVFLKKV